MKKFQAFLVPLVVICVFTFLLAGCNMPTEPDEAAQQTSAAQTAEASITDDQAAETPDSITPTATEPAGDDGNGDQQSTPTENLTPTVTQDSTPTPTEEGEDVGEDQAEFISDVTIPDYTEVEIGDKITKTWRVRNSGTTTWTTDYMIEFEKGEKLGAPTQIKLTKEVKPNEFIDISVDFTVPNTAGEYSSYWIMRNEDGQRVGVAEEGKYFTMFMIIKAVSETSNGGQSGSGGIAGGAKITSTTVSVDKANYSGSCPAQLTFTYKVTTSNAGKVNFQLKFKVVSPSGYTFDATPEYSVDFTGGYTVTYTYTLFSSNAVNATARVEAVGSKTVTSDPVSFSVKCN